MSTYSQIDLDQLQVTVAARNARYTTIIRNAGYAAGLLLKVTGLVWFMRAVMAQHGPSEVVNALAWGCVGAGLVIGSRTESPVTGGRCVLLCALAAAATTFCITALFLR